METDIDAALSRLTTADHPGLNGLEEAVIAEVHARRETRAGIRMAGVAGIAALALGAFAAGSGVPPASAAPLAPFGAAAPLAPSTLLMGER